MKKILTATILIFIAAVLLNSCGGSAEFDPSKNIAVVTREDGSGTKTAFMELVGLKGKADPSNVIIQTGTAGVLTEVKGNQSAIAYESLGYVTGDVKMLKVDGFEATTANIKDGKYKISRPLAIVYKQSSLETEVNSAFFTFLHSKEAEEIIAGKGYVTVTENAQPYTINGSLAGNIDVSGSTSLQPLMNELETAFKKLQPNIKVNVSGGGSGTGYKNAEEGVSVFGMISEEFDSAKASSCVSYTVCIDGIAVIVNNKNPLTDISYEQLKNIYNAEQGENKIKIWDDIIK